MTPRHARWLALAGIIGFACVAQAAGWVEALRYDREAIGAGAAWRVLTGHLVHLGPAHLALNALGLVLVEALVGARLRLGAWTAAFLASAIAISAGLWLGAPQLTWYVGLSGVLHGLLACGAVAALADPGERWFAGALLALVAIKLAWEQLVGALPGTAAAAGGPVIVDAHLLGAVAGFLVGATQLIRYARSH